MWLETPPPSPPQSHGMAECKCFSFPHCESLCALPLLSSRCRQLRDYRPRQQRIDAIEWQMTHWHQLSQSARMQTINWHLLHYSQPSSLRGSDTICSNMSNFMEMIEGGRHLIDDVTQTGPSGQDELIVVIKIYISCSGGIDRPVALVHFILPRSVPMRAK